MREVLSNRVLPLGIPLEYAQKFIATANLDSVLQRLMSLGWSKRNASKALEQYRNFLFLRKKYHHQIPSLIPSVEIDEVWHAHILHTEHYAQFCQQLFGRFLHHRPQMVNENTENTSAVTTAFADTQQLYYEEFGVYLYAIKKCNYIEKLQSWLKCPTTPLKSLNKKGLL